MPQYSLAELLARLRASDPDYFEDKTDDELQQYLFTQHPQYRKQVAPAELPEEYPAVSNEQLHGMSVIETADVGVEDHFENFIKGGITTGITTANFIDGMMNRAMLNAETSEHTHTRIARRAELARMEAANPLDETLQNYIQGERSARVGEIEVAKQRFEQRTLETAARFKPLYDKLDRWSQQEDQAAYEKWMVDTPYSFSQINPDMVMRGVAELAPSVIASVGAGMLGGPVAAAAMMFGMEAGGTRHEALKYLEEQGIDPVEAVGVADEASILYGAIAAPIEYFAMGKMMKFLGLDKAAGRIFGPKLAQAILKNKQKSKLTRIPYNFAASELTQVGQEGLQNMAQLMVEKSYKVYGEDKGLDYRQSYEHFWDDFSQAYHDPSTGQAMWSAGMGMLPGQSLATTRDVRKFLKDGDLREDEDEGPTYDSRDKKFNPAQKAREMYNDIKGRFTKDKDGNILPGIEDEIVDEPEIVDRKTLSDAALTLRRYTSRIEDLTQEELERGEQLEADLGGGDLNNPEVKETWANEIAAIAENAPDAFNEAGIKKTDIIPLLEDPAIIKSHPGLAPKVGNLIAPEPETGPPLPGEDEPEGSAGGVPPVGGAPDPGQAPEPGVDTGTPVNLPKGTGIKVKEPINIPEATSEDAAEGGKAKYSILTDKKFEIRDGEKFGVKVTVDTLSDSFLNQQIKIHEDVLRSGKTSPGAVIQIRLLKSEKIRRERLGLTYVGEAGEAEAFNKQGELDLDTSTKILPVVPTMPEANEEKRTMAIEAAAELLELKKMEGVTIQRGIAPRLGGIGVADRVQGQGIGTRFFNAKAKEFLSRGKTYMEIPVRPGSEGFWTKMGFKKVGVSETAIKHEGKEIFPDLMGRDLVPAPEDDAATAYLDIPNRVSFPPSDDIFDMHAIVDGERVELTEAQKQRLMKIGADKGSMVKFTQGTAEADLYKLGQELIDDADKIITVEDLNVPESEKAELANIEALIDAEEGLLASGMARMTPEEFRALEQKRDQLKGVPHTSNIPSAAQFRKADAKALIENIDEIASKVTQDGKLDVKNAWLVGSTAKKGKGKDVDILYEFNDMAFPPKPEDISPKEHYEPLFDEFYFEHELPSIPLHYDSIVKIKDTTTGVSHIFQFTPAHPEKLWNYIGEAKGHTTYENMMSGTKVDLMEYIAQPAYTVGTVVKTSGVTEDIVGPAPKEMPEGITYSDDGALVVKTSGMTKVKNQMFIPGVTEAMVNLWQGGELIQRAMPNLTADQREFMIDGVTAAEWEAAYPEENDFGIEDIRDGDTAMALLKDDPGNFMLWVSDVPKLQTLEALMDRLKDNPEFMQSLGEDAAKITKALVDEIALRYQRGGQDIVSKMSVFNDGSKKVKKIEFKTNKRAILSNASKDLLGNYPAKVMINELLQNSFDAKATVLEVDIFADSYDSDIDLRFEDNGSGMSPDEVETNLFVFGNRSKGEYDAGSYGQAKAAFMLFPKKFKLTTVKDGVKTVAEGTSDDLLDGHVEIVSTRTTKANGTKFEFLLDATGSNPGKDRYYEALEEQMGKIHRPLRAYVRKFGGSLNESGLKSTDKEFIHLAPHTKYGQMYEGYKLILNELTSAPKRETVHPTLNLDYKGNEIEITFEKRTPYGWKSGYGYGVTNHTLNKGLPLPELTDRFTANLEYNKPNFAIIVDFKKTPLVDSPNYPFIRNRSQYNDDIKKFIQTEIKQVLNAENRHALDLNVKELQEAIDTAPTYGGVKIVLPELVTAKDKLMVHELLATQQAFLSRIGEVFAEYNRMLKEAGYKTIDLVITVDPSTHGWRPNVEDFGGKEVYAINPFALEDDGIERFVTNLVNPHPNIDRLNHRITNLQEMHSHLNAGNFHNFNIIDRSPQVSAVRLTQEQYRDIYGKEEKVLLSEPYNPTDLSIADLRDVIGKKLKLIKSDIDNWNVTETKKLIKEKGPQWRSEIMAHALVHEFAHNWGTGHDEKHASKILEIYMLVGHDNMAKLKNQLLELFNSTGANYENIQKALKEIYRKVDKRAVGFREELAVGGLPESSGKDGRAENSNPLTGEISGAIKDVIAHTGKWHQLRRIYQEAWLRVQEIHAELHGDLGQKVAINKYIKLMQDKLPFWAVDSFRDWYVDAFSLKEEEVWTDPDNGDTLDYFLDEYETDKVLGTLLYEMREGLDLAGDETLDLRYLTKLNAVINVALGIALPIEVQAKWHAEIHQYDTADKWIDGTLEEYTQIPAERLTEWKRDKLKLKYHSLKNTIRTNRADASKNQRHNMVVVMDKNGDIAFEMRSNKNVSTRKENPQYDRNFAGGEDLNLSWLNVKDVLESVTTVDQFSGKKFRRLTSRYTALSEIDLQLFDAKLLPNNKIIAFIRGEGSLAIANITQAHHDIAADDAALLRFWELQGLSKSQIKNVTAQASPQWRAGQIAAYSAVKRHYPEFMDDSLPNVYKRLKIPFTPAIKLNGFRKVTVKVVNKEKLSFVHSDGTEVNAWQEITDMGSLYAGDGGTYTSAKFFKSLYGFLGVNKNSKKSKTVISQLSEQGTFFVKHLMYQPTLPDKGTGVIRIYENYGKDNEKLIGYIHEDGNMYGSPIPTTWSKPKLDAYIKEHKLTSKDANGLIDFFTNDTGQGMAGMVSAAEKVLDDIDGMDPNFSLHQKLEFIAAKEQLLRSFVRKVADQAEVTHAETLSGEAFDLLMTNDEMKVGTKVYEQMQKTGQTFEIDGESIGVLTSTDDKHSYAPYPDQLANHIRDPYLRELFRDHMVPTILEKLRTVFTMARGDVGKRIAEFSEYLRRGPFNAIDNITADYFELGGGMHPSGVGVVESAIQTRRVRPTNRMEGMPGMTEDIEWDLTGTVMEDEASVSAKNASIVYSGMVEDQTLQTIKTTRDARRLPLKEVNEWLDNNELWVLGYRAPTPHVNGAAMLRIRSIHETSDIVYLNPNTIFRGFEGDGDGDHFFIVKLPPEMTRAYRSYYSREEIRAKVKGVNLKKYAKQYTKEYDYTNPADRYELMSSLMEGKKAIAEIAKTQRIYGQLLDVFDYVVVSERGIETKVRMIQPDTLIKTPKFEAGSEHTVEDILRIYIQAAVDNGKYMLLSKWGYTSEKLRRQLFVQENGEPITETQWAAVRPLLALQGRTTELRRGASFSDGIFDFSTQIKNSTAHLEYMEDRRALYFVELNKKPHFVRDQEGEISQIITPMVTDIVFTGETSIQEDIVTQVALLNRKYERAGDAGSPFKLLGYDDTHGTGVTIYHMAHDEAVHLIQDDKWDMDAVPQEELNAGYHYANNMFTAFGNMWGDFKDKGIDPGFLGWSTNVNMVNFAEKWDKEFKKLSTASQQVATYRFLEGVYRSVGKIRFIRQIPPISGRATGITTLDPDIMRKYLKRYNEVLQDPENRSTPTVRNRTEFVEFEVEAHKKGCK